MSEGTPPHYGERLRRDVEVMAFSDVVADSAFMPSRLALQLTNVHFVGLTVQPGRWRRGGGALNGQTPPHKEILLQASIPPVA